MKIRNYQLITNKFKYSIAIIISIMMASCSEAAKEASSNTTNKPNNPSSSLAIEDPGAQQYAENDQVILPIKVRGADNNSLQYVALDLPPNLSIDPNTGVISGMLDWEAAGQYNSKITVVVTGNKEKSVDVLWNINNTNRLPKLLDIKNIVAEEGSSFNFEITAQDDDGDTLNFQIEGLPDFASSTQINNTEKITISPNYQDAGLYSVTVSVADDIEPDNPVSASFDLDVRDATGSLNNISINIDTSITNVKSIPNDNGDILTLWTDTNTNPNRILFSYYNASTGSWSNATPLLENINSYSALSNEDTYLIIWEQGGSLYGRPFKDGSWDGATVQTIAAAIDTTFPYQIYKSSGSFAVVWMDNAIDPANRQNIVRIFTLANTQEQSVWLESEPMGNIGISRTNSVFSANEIGFAMAWIERSSTSIFANIYDGVSWVTAEKLNGTTMPATDFIGIKSQGTGHLVTWTDFPVGNVYASFYQPQTGWVNTGMPLGPTGYMFDAPILASNLHGYAVVWTSNDGVVLYANVLWDNVWFGYEQLNTPGLYPNGLVAIGNEQGYTVVWDQNDSISGTFKPYTRVFEFNSQKNALTWGDGEYLRSLSRTNNIKLNKNQDSYIITDITIPEVNAYIRNSGKWNYFQLDNGIETDISGINLTANSSGYAIVWKRTVNGFFQIAANTFYNNNWLDQPHIIGDADANTLTPMVFFTGQLYCANWTVNRQDNNVLQHLSSVCGF